jgi:NACHT domain
MATWKLSSLNPFVYRENAFDVISKIPRVIIRGPAGSGKTTILHWLISHCDLFERDCELPSPPFLPIYVPLRKLEGIQNLDSEINNLFHHVIANSELQSRLPHNFISKITWPFLFMFDGVGEITNHNRDHFWKCVYEICVKWPQSHIIITSRNLSICHLANSTYRDDIYTSPDAFTAATRQWRPPIGFLEFTVAPLSIEEIVQFVDSWFMGVDENLIPRNQWGIFRHFQRDSSPYCFSQKIAVFWSYLERLSATFSEVRR